MTSTIKRFLEDHPKDEAEFPQVECPYFTRCTSKVPTLLNGFTSRKIYQLGENDTWHPIANEFPSNGSSSAVSIDSKLILFNKQKEVWFSISDNGGLTEMKKSLFSSMMCSIDENHFVTVDAKHDSLMQGSISILDKDLAVVAKLPEVAYRGFNNDSYIGLCCDSDELFIIGEGFGWGPHAGVKSIRLDEADPIWLEQPPLSQARCDHAAVLINGSIYVIGGRHKGGRLATIEKFDRRIGKWIKPHNENLCFFEKLCKPKAELKRGRCEFGAAVFLDEIWVAGGIDGAYLDTVEIYCPRNNQLRPGPSIPEPNCHMGFVCFKHFH